MSNYLLTDDYNLYSYAWNNPLKYTDPTGMGESDWYKRKKLSLTDKAEYKYFPDKHQKTYIDESEMEIWERVNYGSKVQIDGFTHTLLQNGKAPFTFQPSEIPVSKPSNPSAQVGHASVNIKSLKTSSQGIRFITSFEQGPNGGVALTDYDAGDNERTIGWGHVIKPFEQHLFKGITPKQAEEIFASDIKIFENLIKKHVKVPLTQFQFDALVSYVYNTGSLVGTKLLKNLNNKDYNGAVTQMDIVTSQGIVVRGLVIRRSMEHKIWNKGIYEYHK